MAFAWGMGRSIENLSNFPTIATAGRETNDGKVVNVIVLFQAPPLNSATFRSRLKYFYTARARFQHRDISRLHTAGATALSPSPSRSFKSGALSSKLYARPLR